MAPTGSKEVAYRFIQVWNAGQRHVVDELAAPDIKVSYAHFREDIRGRLAFKEMLSQTHEHFPDLAIEVHDVVADGSQAVVHWTYRGAFQDGELFGISASGQSVAVKGITMYDVEDGKVIRERGVVDNFGLMIQLGAEPATMA